MQKVFFITFFLSTLFNYIYSRCESTVIRCSQFSISNFNQTRHCAYHHKEGVKDVFDVDTSRCYFDEKCPAINANTPKENVTCALKTYNDVEGVGYDTFSCKHNRNCWSENCSGSKCVGRDDGTNCTENNECKIGSYCWHNKTDDKIRKCQPQLKAGDNCTRDYDCGNTMGCYKYNSTTQEVCKEYFSIKNGEKIQTNSQFELLCESGTAVNGECTPFELHEVSDQCFGSQSTCSYKYTNKNESKYMDVDCVCSPSEPNKSFCKYLTDSDEYKSIFTEMKSFVTGDGSKKHTDFRSAYAKSLKDKLDRQIFRPELRYGDKCYLEITKDGRYITGLLSLFLVLLLA